MSKRDFVRQFQDTLADHGDMFFSSGDIKQDYYTIISTIDTQGYWTGNSLRYFFGTGYKLLRTEQRRFGQ